MRHTGDLYLEEGVRGANVNIRKLAKPRGKNRKMPKFEFEEAMECGVCLAQYDRPVQLTCGHTYCEACINRLAQQANQLGPVMGVPLGVMGNDNIFIQPPHQMIRVPDRNGGVGGGQAGGDRMQQMPQGNGVNGAQPQQQIVQQQMVQQPQQQGQVMPQNPMMQQQQVLQPPQQMPHQYPQQMPMPPHALQNMQRQMQNNPGPWIMMHHGPNNWPPQPMGGRGPGDMQARVGGIQYMGGIRMHGYQPVGGAGGMAPMQYGRRPQQKVSCPECRQVTTIPNNGLPVNYKLQDLIEKVKASTKALPIGCICQECSVSIDGAIYFACKNPECREIRTMCAMCGLRNHNGHMVTECRVLNDGELIAKREMARKLAEAAVACKESCRQIADKTVRHADHILELADDAMKQFDVIDSELTRKESFTSEAAQLRVDRANALHELFKKLESEMGQFESNMAARVAQMSNSFIVGLDNIQKDSEAAEREDEATEQVPEEENEQKNTENLVIEVEGHGPSRRLELERLKQQQKMAEVHAKRREMMLKGKTTKAIKTEPMEEEELATRATHSLNLVEDRERSLTPADRPGPSHRINDNRTPELPAKRACRYVTRSRMFKPMPEDNVVVQAPQPVEHQPQPEMVQMDQNVANVALENALDNIMGGVLEDDERVIAEMEQQFMDGDEIHGVFENNAAIRNEEMGRIRPLPLPHPQNLQDIMQEMMQQHMELVDNVVMARGNALAALENRAGIVEMINMMNDGNVRNDMPQDFM